MSGGGAVGGNVKEAYRGDVERIDDGRKGRDKKKRRGDRATGESKESRTGRDSFVEINALSLSLAPSASHTPPSSLSKHKKTENHACTRTFNSIFFIRPSLVQRSLNSSNP